MPSRIATVYTGQPFLSSIFRLKLLSGLLKALVAEYSGLKAESRNAQSSLAIPNAEKQSPRLGVKSISIILSGKSKNLV